MVIMFNQPVVYECFGSSSLGDSPNNLGDSYMMTRGIQSAIILTGTRAVGTLLISTINAGLLLCSLSCLGSIKLKLFY